MRIGFIGLGAMGSAMALNLRKGGFEVLGCDLDPGAQARWRDHGGELAAVDLLLQQCGAILTAVSDSLGYERLADSVLIPGARAGQIFADFTTVTPPAIRRLHKAFAKKRAHLLECPMTGGEGGAREGTLRFFVAGDKAVFAQMRPVLEAMGDPERVAFVGEPGAGQLMKGVNQLGMGLIMAAALESVAYGVRGGLSYDAIEQLVGGSEPFRAMISKVCQLARQEDGLKFRGVKCDQLPYFIEEATEAGYTLPLAQALFAFLEGREPIVREANRLSPSFWDALNERLL